jgi:hypothetical protein
VRTNAPPDTGLSAEMSKQIRDPLFMTPRKTQGSTLLFADLAQCRPRAALDAGYRAKAWRVLPYQTADFHGNLILALDGTQPPTLRFKLRARGRFDISLGLYPTVWNESSIGGIAVRFRGEKYFRSLQAGKASNEQRIHEVFWKRANLDGQDLEIAPFCWHGFGAGSASHPVSALAFIRLTPSREPLPPADKPQSTPLWLGAFVDGHSLFYCGESPGHTGAHHVRQTLEVFRGTPFRKLYWCNGWGDSGHEHTYSHASRLKRPYLTSGYRRVDQALTTIHREGKLASEVARDHLHGMGIEFHFYHRPGLVAGEPPFDDVFPSSFVREHPEFLCKDRDGTAIARSSYAFTAVQDLVLEKLRIDLSRNMPDGLCLAMHRGVPLLWYEQPVLDAFAGRTGPRRSLDPRRLPQDDPRVIGVRCDLITAYLRRVRELLDEFTAPRGTPLVRRSRRLSLSAIVLASRKANRFYGLDVEQWVREGLVDTIMPYQEGRLVGDGVIKLADFARLPGLGPCQLAPEMFDVRSWLTPETHYGPRAEHYQQFPVSGITFWDVEMRQFDSLNWESLCAAATPRQLKSRLKRIAARDRWHAILSIGGIQAGRFPTWWTF